MTDGPTGFMCRIDFEDELYFADGGNVIYPSVEDLKAHHKSADHCGIGESTRLILADVRSPFSENHPA